MGDQTVTRRLAAVLAADVAGYTRLMEKDTDGTVAAWQAARQDVIRPRVAEHSGRIVKLTGDGFLVEFPTVQDAVRCAISMQAGLASSHLKFRMGVNLGDIVDDGEDIHGEGVNIAARIEALADEGGINISGDVYNQVRNRIEATYEDQGEHEVKNVSAPVRVYAITRSKPVAETAQLVASIAAKPSIAVLPFDNLSGDPEQDFIGDGLTEDIITGLSRIRSFFVIARNSTFQYKGTSPDIRHVAEELGVRYVLEGSVRKSGERVRVTAQLIDAPNNNHIWAERFDREFTDIFAVQDEITAAIVGQLEPELGRAEYERVKAEQPQSLDAWGLYHRGTILVHRRTRDGLLEARRLFEQALELDSGFAPALAGLVWSLTEDVFFGYEEHDKAGILNMARRAVALDGKDPFVHFALSWAYFINRQLESSAAAAKKAIELNPSYAHAYVMLAGTYTHSGRPAEGIPLIETAIKLSPADPSVGLWNNRLAISHLFLEEYQTSVELARTAFQLHENWLSSMTLTSALAHLGRLTEAQAALAEFKSLAPEYSVEFVRRTYSVFHPPSQAILLDGLRKAGLPEN